MALAFRDARSTDGPALIEMIGSVLREFELVLDLRETDVDLADVEAFYARAGGRFELLVDDKGRVVGSCGMRVHAWRDDASAEGFELRKMYLAPDARGQGWGRVMLERALAFARDEGASWVVLESATRLTRALQLYRSYGFVESDEPPPAQRCDLSMCLKLN